MANMQLDREFGRIFLDDILDWVGTHLSPSDVFSETDLREWAESNGYVDEEECENDS